MDVPCDILTAVMHALVAPLNAAEFSSDGEPNRGPEIFAFYVNWDVASRSALAEHLADIDVLIPEWLHLAEDGSIAVDDPDRTDWALDLISERKPNLRIAPLLNNFSNGDWQAQWVNQVLASPDRRTYLVNEIRAYLNDNDFDGVTIGLQGIDAGALPAFVELAKELHGALLPSRRAIYYLLPMGDEAFPADQLVAYSDGLIVMGYGQGAGTMGAGPPAPRAWFERALTKHQKVVPSSKLVLGLANLAFDWAETGEAPQTLSFQEALARGRTSNASVTLDEQHLNSKFSYLDAELNEHTVWLLDAVSAYNQWQIASTLAPGAIALWRLGTEDPSIWSMLRHPYLTPTQGIESISYTYQVDRFGAGEVTRVVKTPQQGHRSLTWSADGKLITGAQLDAYPHGYAIKQWGAAGKSLALTFDDGPDPTFTPQVLEILQRYGIKATFFATGNNMLRHPDMVKRVLAEGHEVGNHTFSHANISKIGPELLRLELNATQRVFETISGRSLTLFRAPYAVDINPQTADEIAPLTIIGDMGYYSVNMNIDPHDWWLPDADRVVERTVRDARSGLGNVILLHDGGGNRSETVEALPHIIERLQAEGFRFVTVSDLIGQSRDSVMPIATHSGAPVMQVQAAGIALWHAGDALLAFLFFAAIGVGIVRSSALIGLSFSRRKQLPLEVLPDLSVGIVVPAYNEEKVVVSTVNSLLQSGWPDLQILVVDDGSTDGTYQLCRHSFAHCRQVKVVTKPNGGKAAALDYGFSRLETDIVIALDADTVFLEDTVTRLVSHFADEKVAAVAGNAKVGNRVNLLTKLQALEYITAQNLDRRAFERLNCISVVPGAVGAWRRDLVLQAGGFSTDTLAEDADLTIALLRQGHRIAYEPDAIALTEAPESLRQFMKQRFRWTYGTLQVAIKHAGALRLQDSKPVGLVTLPNILVAQILLPLLAPVTDLMAVLSLGLIVWDLTFLGATDQRDLLINLAMFGAFMAFDLTAAGIAFWHEGREDKRLLIWLVPQRFFYRQIIYFVVIRAFLAAIRGSAVGWGILSRTAKVATAIESYKS